MAFKPGKGAFVLMDGVAGSLVDITAYADNLSLSQPIDTLDVSVFGSNYKAFIPGLAGGGQVSLSGPSDVGLGTFLAGVHAAQAAGSTSSTVVYGPGGSVAGQIKQTAEGYITDYQVSTAVGGRAEYSATLQITGAVANATW